RARDAYATARQRALERDPTLIARSGRASFQDGTFTIVYSWTNAKQAADWVADPQVSSSGVRVDAARGVAAIKGHVTNAVKFAGKVRVRTVAGSVEGASANLNVVFDEDGPGTGLLVGLGYDD